VEQLLDLQQELHLVGSIHAVPRPVLARPQHAELRLPVAQHVRLHADQVADFADRPVELGIPVPIQFRRGQVGPPFHTSLLSSRVTSASNASRGLRPSKIAHICSLIGRSTWCRRARSSAARAVFTPSATITMLFRICSNVSPRPSLSPSPRLRL